MRWHSSRMWPANSSNRRRYPPGRRRHAPGFLPVSDILQDEFPSRGGPPSSGASRCRIRISCRCDLNWRRNSKTSASAAKVRNDHRHSPPGEGLHPLHQIASPGACLRRTSLGQQGENLHRLMAHGLCGTPIRDSGTKEDQSRASRPAAPSVATGPRRAAVRRETCWCPGLRNPWRRSYRDKSGIAGSCRPRTA